VTLKSMVHRGTALPTFAAMIQMGLGQRDEALDSLVEMSRPKVGAGLQGLDQWHIFDQLHADSRYQKLVAQARKRDLQPSQ
jgi:hypothetical protein